MTQNAIHGGVAAYYSDRLARFGATAAGVDWRDEASQAVRFDQLLRVMADPYGALVDLGCGYGALLTHMRNLGFNGPYHGVDIAPDMVAAAAHARGHVSLVTFETGAEPSVPADYAVASGIFNVRLGTPEDEWKRYVAATIEALDRAGTKGFAFNCLTAYSDADRMRPDLYYGDPCHYFDLCKRSYSRQVVLLHDYGLYEFTIIVRKG